MTFREEIEKELDGLSKKQQVEFAWRCAVRALPFLGAQGNFDFWKTENSQEHLLSVFLALDNAFSTATPTLASTLSAAVAAASSASSASSISSAYLSAAATTTAIYASVVSSAVIPTDSSSAMEALAAFSAANASADPSSAMEALAAFSATNAASRLDYKINLIPVIQQDLKLMKDGEPPQLDIADYGEVWTNFQKALMDYGCGYWAKLYQDIFENNFRIDHGKLERRLHLPEEIKEQGAAVVGEYLEKLERQGAKRLNEARIIILGDKGVGKTCVARKLKDPNAEMTTPDESTAGVETTLWELEKEDINVRIWDFAGHTVTHAVHQFFLSARCLYIMVYDGRSEKRNDLEYWLNHMKNYGGDSKAIILVNERDKHAVKIPINKFKEKYPIVGFYSFNVEKNKTKLKEFRSEVADFIKDNPSWKNQEIPTSYYQVKEELESRFNKKQGEPGKEHITKEVFEQIAKKYKVEDSAQLLKDLHALGVSLWYKDMDDFDTLILNPEWISEGVYKIINWASNKSKHEISLASFSKIFEEELIRYPKDKHRFLFNLIKHYELAFETNNGKSLVIPHLLHEDQPAELPKFAEGESLMMRYEADHPLPPNTISRFIVRHNAQIKKDGEGYLVWNYGVILESKEGDIALVIEEERKIVVSVKGVDKTNFISELRATLNAIFESYQTKKPELKYELIELGNRPDNLLSEKEIVGHAARNRPFFNITSGQEFSLEPILERYALSADIININIIRENDTVLLGGKGNIVNRNIFNFYDSKNELQGEFTELARRLAKKGEAEEAEELTDFVEVLDEVQKDSSPEEIKKKGIFSRLKRLAVDLGDKESKLYKALDGVKNAYRIARNIIDIVEKIPPIF